MVIQVRDEEIWNETETVGITKSSLTSEMFEKEGLEDLDIGETWGWGGGRIEGYAQLSDPGEWMCGGVGEKKCSGGAVQNGVGRVDPELRRAWPSVSPAMWIVAKECWC